MPSLRPRSSADSLKLRGRMQFTAGQLFGRVAKTCLAKVTNQAYRSGSTDVSDSLASSLPLFKTFLLAQRPRLVSRALSQFSRMRVASKTSHGDPLQASEVF